VVPGLSEPEPKEFELNESAKFRKDEKPALDYPIVDAHLHIWDPNHIRMPWLDEDALLNRRFDLGDYRQATAGLQVEAMVYVQVNVAPAYGLIEPRWVAEQAKADPRLKGIVAWAPLEYGERARSYLSALTEVSPLVKGVRRMTQMELHHDPEFCLRPDFVRGVQLLPEYGLSCDIDLDYYQLPSYVKMVEQCPGTSFILDHIAKPDIKGRVFAPWRDGVSELAAFPNVMCKISGLTVQTDRERWTIDDLRPYLEHAFEVFGEDRVAFGGDWPVVLQAATYRRWFETLEAFTAPLSPAAKRKLWAENARRFYRL
jgi:L-fuconolactonase